MVKKISKNAITIAGLSGLMLLGAAGGMLAYLTDAETADNTFTIGNVQVESLEKNYPGNDSNDVKNITPGQETKKDPQIKNDGINDAVAFVVLDSPVDICTLVDDNGNVTTASPVAQEVFYYKDAQDAIGTHANNFDAGWQLLANKSTRYIKITEDAATGKVTAEEDLGALDAAGLQQAVQGTKGTNNVRIVKRYVFGYKTPIHGSDKTDGSPQTDANKITTPLFDKVQLKNVLEGEIDRNVEKIRVMSLAMQASNVISEGKDITKDDSGVAKTSYSEADLSTMYDIFVKQNSKSSSGKDTEMNEVVREGNNVRMRDADSNTPTVNGADGSTDPHYNRWDQDRDATQTNANVTNAGQNVAPNPTYTTPTPGN